MSGPDAPKKCQTQGCEFYGSDQNSGLCSSCARSIKSDSISQSPGSNSVRLQPDSTPKKSTSTGLRSSTSLSFSRKRKSTEIVTDDTSPQSTSESESRGAGKAKAKRSKVNRCDVCFKKVGLLGFDCRCGGLFCAQHRGDDEHNCTFDYKTLQRAELAQNNPKIVADRVTKL